MRKLILVITTSLLLGTITFVACKKGDKPIPNSQNMQNVFLQIDDNDIGGIHNEAMEYAELYNFDTTSSSLLYESIYEFVADYFQTNYPIHFNPSLIVENLNLIFEDTLNQKLADLETQWTLIEDLSYSELELLRKIRLMIDSNFNGSLSNLNFHIQIHALELSTPNLASTKIAASVLKIATASTDYWIDQGNLEPDPLVIAPWVARDAAGALVGGTLASVRNGSLSDIGSAALITGATASLGLVNKIAKGIMKYFGS